MRTVFIKGVIQNYDCRRIHRLRGLRAARQLAQMEVLLALNRERKLARIVDSAGAIHSYYAPKGTRYDVKRLQEIATDALGLQLEMARPIRATRPARKKAA
jgi:hypothetical protein